MEWLYFSLQFPKYFKFHIMKIILVLICFALTNCIFSNKLVKKDIDAKFVYYNLDCNLLNGDELDCKIDYDLENIQNVYNQNLALNESEIIILLYNILYQVSSYGKEMGFKYGQMTNWGSRLDFLKNNPENRVRFKFFNTVEPENLQGYSYHLAINKPYRLQDSIDVYNEMENNYKKWRNDVRDPVIDDRINLVLNYKIQSFVRQSSHYNHNYAYVSNKIFNNCKVDTIDLAKNENIIYIKISIYQSPYLFQNLDGSSPIENTTSSRRIQSIPYPSEISTYFDAKSEKNTILETIPHGNNIIGIESFYSKKYSECYTKVIEDFLEELLNPKNN
jgi:hypothetical protein